MKLLIEICMKLELFDRNDRNGYTYKQWFNYWTPHGEKSYNITFTDFYETIYIK